MGIAGPGDPFANPEETMETLRLVRRKFPKMILCVATNGLGVVPYVDEMADLKVSHITLTINAVDPVIGGKIYAWVRDGKRPLRGEEAAAALGAKQIEALVRLKARGIVVKVNTIIMPGINDDHIPDIAKKVSALGADIMNLMPLVPVKGAVFEDVPPPDTMTTRGCACNADSFAADDALRPLPGRRRGLRRRERDHRTNRHACNITPTPELEPAEDAARPYVAVATLEGALVNQHLGEADRLAIYEANAALPGNFRLVEIRRTPDEGGGEARWATLADSLKDCRAILVNAAGPTPKRRSPHTD
jgi:nitrogen fixation protein NifB